eukprot:GFKZ01003988.1.p1 GENE.GFKZ01003988.1~~GFKZ01003988.1.p1  ORF type:complete len:987 (+),score=164.44 GFKZ01003988.1:121-3081(+)
MAEQVSSYIALQKELLSLERDAEREETALASTGAKLSALESSGLAITRLSHRSTTTNASGRAIVQLGTRGGRQLSAARISSGDIVGVRAHTETALLEGVVTALDETSISVSLDDALEGDEEGSLYVVLKLTSDVTHKRYIAALDALGRAVADPTHVAHTLVHVLLDGREPRFAGKDGTVREALLHTLNSKQREAVMCALRSKDLAVVHGPPGTGKTHTIAAYILAEVERGNRVLVVAPSNVAVDNVAERLARSAAKLKFVRAGHPARIIPTVSKYGLEAQLLHTEEAGLAKDIRTELGQLEGKLGKTKERRSRRDIRTEMKELRRELRNREKVAVRRLLGSMDVVLATISGAGARVLDIAEDAVPFDVVVVDEAAQALEAACWVPLLRAKKAVLAGDPYQLAGTVKSVAAEERGLKKSILDRVFATKALQSCVTMLCTQYRMNKLISKWSSEEFYEGKLVADSAVAEHRVADLDSCKAEVEDDQNLVNPFILIDTAGGDCEEDDLSQEIAQDSALASSHIASASRSNKGEAEIVSSVVNEFIHYGLSLHQLGVISPYSGQVELLRRSLWPKHGRKLEIATIDSFQGREKEVICISLVRSNEQGDVGFLSDDRRLNVAITRARRCVVVVCDSEAVSTHPLLQRMVEYAENFGDYRSAVTDFPEIVGTYSLQRRPNEAIEAEQRSIENKKRRPKRDGPKKPANRLQSASGVRVVKDSSDFPKKSDTGSRVTPKSELKEELELFCSNSGLKERVFPVELSSQSRRFVHELAEEFRLGHETTEVASGRQIRIWKRQGMKKLPENPQLISEANAVEEHLFQRTSPGIFNELRGNDMCHDSAERPRVNAEPPQDSSSEYRDMNNILKEAREARELRKAQPLSGIQNDSAKTGALHEGAASGARKRSKRKGRGKSKKQEDDSDDDFDAVLAKYGAPQSSAAAGSTTDLVRQIIDGKIVGKPATQKVNTQAKQRLAAKLAQQADKRSRKVKPKK